MLNPIDFLQLGIAGVAIIVIAIIVEKFLKAQKEFLNVIQIQEKNFRETINNHLSESAKADRDLSMTITELLVWLRRSNGRH